MARADRTGGIVKPVAEGHCEGKLCVFGHFDASGAEGVGQ